MGYGYRKIALLRSTQKRLSELERLIQSLYEDKVLGNLPETVFKELMIKYAWEYSEKQKTAQQLIKNLSEHQKEESSIEQYMEKIRRYVSVETLDREMLLELIKYIEIGERKQLGNQKYRDIVIHYNLIDISK